MTRKTPPPVTRLRPGVVPQRREPRVDLGAVVSWLGVALIVASAALIVCEVLRVVDEQRAEVRRLGYVPDLYPTAVALEPLHQPSVIRPDAPLAMWPCRGATSWKRSPHCARTYAAGAEPLQVDLYRRRVAR